MSDQDAPKHAPSEGAKRLSIVLPEHELRGHAPLRYERLTKSARPGSAEHRGLLAVARALAKQATARCLPPSARGYLEPAFSSLDAFISGHSASQLSAREARIATFAALPALETLTLDAVAKASGAMSESKQTALYEHATHTLGRQLGLSVHHAVAAVCHTLDAIETIEQALSVPSDACGALAYSRTALGSARNPAFQQGAIEQARFEHERMAQQRRLPLAALEVQVFHEYLGARWRAHADQERRASDEFIAWALGSA